MDSNSWFSKIEHEVYVELLSKYHNAVCYYLKRVEERIKLQKIEDEAYEAYSIAVDNLNAVGANWPKLPRS